MPDPLDELQRESEDAGLYTEYQPVHTHYVLGVPPKIGSLLWWTTAPFSLCEMHYKAVPGAWKDRYGRCDCGEWDGICDACSRD
jgi:hypothetical protein